jgi:hypothetical protein
MDKTKLSAAGISTDVEQASIHSNRCKIKISHFFCQTNNPNVMNIIIISIVRSLIGTYFRIR